MKTIQVNAEAIEKAICRFEKVIDKVSVSWDETRLLNDIRISRKEIKKLRRMINKSESDGTNKDNRH